MTRREAISIMGAGFGMVGLRGIAEADVARPVLAKAARISPAKAKRVISPVFERWPLACGHI